MTHLEAMMTFYKECERAEKIHPVWPTDLIHQIAIVAEESGEAVQAALNHVYHGKDIDLVREELIQTGAMCIRALVNLEGVTNAQTDVRQ